MRLGLLKTGFVAILFAILSVSSQGQGLYFPSEQNLIQNGSFETAGPNNNNPFPPWVYTGGLFISAGICQTADGTNAVGIISGLLYQDISTVPGQEYDLSFYVAGFAPTGPPPVVHNIAVDWGSLLVGTTSFNSTGRTFSNMGWALETFGVTATGTTTRLTFSNPNANSNPNIPLIDDVQLVAAPEPSTTALYGLGLVVLLFACRHPAIGKGKTVIGS